MEQLTVTLELQGRRFPFLLCKRSSSSAPPGQSPITGWTAPPSPQPSRIKLSVLRRLLVGGHGADRRGD